MKTETITWIRIKDELPPEDGIYLFALYDTTVESMQEWLITGGYYRKEAERKVLIICGGGYSQRLSQFTHWARIEGPNVTSQAKVTSQDSLLHSILFALSLVHQRISEGATLQEVNESIEYILEQLREGPRDENN